jgi:hypothetical protein
MNSITKSEKEFELFCNQAGIPCRPIPTEPDQGRQTPDYELEISGVQIFAEVKQFDLTPEEQKEIRQLEEQDPAFAWDREPGARARKKISEAVAQLKQRVEAGQPAMLVLYNNDPFTRRPIDPYSIMTAMYGVEEISIEVPTNPSKGGRFMGMDFGGKRKLTPTDNTTLSAICVLTNESGEVHLNIYHNRYAANPLDPNLLRHHSVRHFTLGPKELRGLQDWVEI